MVKEPNFETEKSVTGEKFTEIELALDGLAATTQDLDSAVTEATSAAEPSLEKTAPVSAAADRNETEIAAASVAETPAVAHTPEASDLVTGAPVAVAPEQASESGVVVTDNTPTAAPVAADETPAVGAPATPAAHPLLVLPLADMTPEERFRATTRLIFLAPDVPPVQPRQRRSELTQLDDLLDRQSGRNFRDRDDRGTRADRFDRNDRNDRSARSDRFDRSERTDRADREDRNERLERADRAVRFDRDERESHDDQDASALRRRSRRRNGADVPVEEEAPRQSARQVSPITEPQKVKGSTRLEAKKQRRRDGRDAGRRRRLVITESEFLARRESVDREMVVRTTADRIQIGVLEDKVLVEHYVARSSESSIIGNVYLGRVQNVLPSMEAAFVDIGRGRNAVLYSGEVDWSEFEGSGNARRIESVLKPGDQVLVQVTKDPVGHKGARLTSQISLPGRFLVYVPGGAMNGISRKLPDTERARLKKILKEVLPNGAGVIVRTAAEGATEDQLTNDVQRLTRQWDSIYQRSQKGGGPTLLHSEPDMLIKIVRDVFNEDFHKLLIQGNETYDTIAGYLEQVAPELLERVERYESPTDIFDDYRIAEQITKALDRKVWLPSGGSLVIDRTEAMTVVDVNTGKFVGSGGNLEETVTKNNLEAAEEIVRQLRLRDIGGIIVVDFIDMVLESNRDLVLRRMVECLSRDRTKHQVAEVTSLGLVQMTRKKLGLGLLESFSEPCEACAGRGVLVQQDPIHRHRSESQGQNQGQTNRSKRKGSGNNSNSHSNHNAGASSSQQQSASSHTSGSNGNHSAVDANGADSQRGAAQSSSASALNGQGQGQTHAITAESRTMLAKIAAKTIPTVAESSVESEAVASKSVPTQAPERRNAAKSRRASKEEAAAAVLPVDAETRVEIVSTLAASPAQAGLVEQLVVETAQKRSTRARRASNSDANSSDSGAALFGNPEDLLGSVLDALPAAPEPGKRRSRSRRVSTAAIVANESVSISLPDAEVN